MSLEAISQFTPSPKEISEGEIQKIALEKYPKKVVGAMSKEKGIFKTDLREAERNAFIEGLRLSLPSSGRKTEEDYWKRRCELAEDCLSKSPCDPDITPEQIEANKKYQLFLKDKQQ